MGVDSAVGAGIQQIAGNQLTNNLSLRSDDQLRELLKASRQVLTTLAQMLEDRPDMEHAVRRLMSPENTLETFNTLAGNDPVSMQRVLQASVGGACEGAECGSD